MKTDFLHAQQPDFTFRIFWNMTNDANGQNTVTKCLSHTVYCYHKKCGEDEEEGARLQVAIGCQQLPPPVHVQSG
jgi:hypothetical protein